MSKRNGSEFFSTITPYIPAFSTPVGRGDHLIFAEERGSLVYCFDLANEMLLWKRDAGARVRAVWLWEPSSIIIETAQSLCIIDELSGRQRASVALDGYVSGVAGDLLVIGHRDKNTLRLSAVDIRSGEEQWFLLLDASSLVTEIHATNDFLFVSLNPRIITTHYDEDDSVTVVPDRYKIVCIRSFTGEVLWTTSVPLGTVTRPEVHVCDGRTHVILSANNLIECISKTTGTSEASVVSPNVICDVMYDSATGTAVVLGADSEGRIQHMEWRCLPRLDLLKSTAVDEAVFGIGVGTAGGIVLIEGMYRTTAIDGGDGSVVWSRDLWNATIMNGKLVFGGCGCGDDVLQLGECGVRDGEIRILFVVKR